MGHPGLPADYSKPTFLNVDYHAWTSWTVLGVCLSVGYKPTLRKNKRVPTRLCLEPPGPPPAAPGPHEAFRQHLNSATDPPKRWGFWGLNPPTRVAHSNGGPGPPGIAKGGFRTPPLPIWSPPWAPRSTPGCALCSRGPPGGLPGGFGCCSFPPRTPRNAGDYGG